jgi:hypothetical protein
MQQQQQQQQRLNFHRRTCHIVKEEDIGVIPRNKQHAMTRLAGLAKIHMVI